ncbi:PEGA domain-containing protein [Archangium violaceum]|uniref:PEGA domain-containing protein n=1 Tax=Archangium violaceum TaxID=83451 RepID=UPI00193B2EB6|nr:PEGA domain-containing protein [Archangium violaceum]QRK12480.1 PEGA domain-containing protein [Archangium violaceum]
MRTPVVCVAGLLALALAAGPARAQGGLGLDLSGDSNTQTPQEQSQDSSEDAAQDSGNLGLDLSGGSADADLQPRFALVGLETPERAGAAVAKRWVGWLQAQALRSGRVVRVAETAEVRQQLEADYDSALRCQEASCLRGPADMLDADLLTTARLALEDEGWTLRLWTYDRDRGVVEMDVVTGRKPNDSNFIREAGEVLSKRVEELARPRALLKVSCNVSQAVVRVGERMLGVGNVEAKLPPGEVELIVEADEYSSYTKTLTLASGETQEVSVRLEFNGPAPEGPPEDVVVAKKSRKSSSGPSLFSRPAFYTTVLGLAAVGAGVALGMGLQGKAQDANGDGVIDISRKEYLAARQQSTISTALMAGGGAVAGGSLLWLLIVPQRSAPASSTVAPVSSGTGTSGTTALHFVIGGSF